MTCSAPTTIVDLSHPVETGMPMFPGLPGPVVGQHLGREETGAHYAAGTSFLISTVSLVGNTGTYLDSPFHRFAAAPDVAAIELRRLVDLPGIVIEPGLRNGRLVLDADVVGGDCASWCGRAVLIRTGWDRFWSSAGYLADGAPYVTAAAARQLAVRRPAVVGIDCQNIDDMADLTRPVHTILLGAGIPILENLTSLCGLPRQGFRFFAAPVAVRGAASMPVRAFALVAR